MGALQEEGVAPKTSRNIFSQVEICEIRENKCCREPPAVRYTITRRRSRTHGIKHKSVDIFYRVNCRFLQTLTHCNAPHDARYESRKNDARIHTRSVEGNGAVDGVVHRAG